MKRITQSIVVAALTLFAATAFADTLLLKNGERVSGYYEGGTTRVVKFRGADGNVRDYDILGVDRLQFGDVPQAAAPVPVRPATPAAATPIPVTPSPAPPRLIPNEPRPVVGTAPLGTAAKSEYTLGTGTKIVIRLVDSIDSERQKPGDSFVAVLDEAIVVNNVEVAARGADVRGRISMLSAAARGNNAAQLGLELTNLHINGINYALTTSEYNEVAPEKDVKTATRGIGGAAIGAVIGAIAGGGKGAAIGAGVGGGAGVASAVMTKGEKLNIPSETKLEFTLRSPLAIAGK